MKKEPQEAKREVYVWDFERSEYVLKGTYPEPRHDAEIMSIEEMEKRAEELKKGKATLSVPGPAV